MQTLVPHAQSREFSASRSVAVHAATFEHLPVEAKQYRPVDTSQSLDPHTQSLEFSALPSAIVHAATLEHLLDAAKQIKPVDASQSVVPQVHSALLADKPVATTHAFDDVMVIVSSFQILLPHALIGVGLEERSGRKTSSVQ